VALVGRLVRSTLDDGLFHVPARGVAGVSIVRDDVEVEALSAGMQRLNGDYARSFNHRHNRRGHLFAGRFSSWVIEGDEYLENTVRYVLLNPVRAGLCRRPSDWRWSASRYGKDV
jgi:hypothetical protein